MVTNSKRKRPDTATEEDELSKSWRDLLGPPPPMGTTKVSGLVVVMNTADTKERE